MSNHIVILNAVVDQFEREEPLFAQRVKSTAGFLDIGLSLNMFLFTNFGDQKVVREVLIEFRNIRGHNLLNKEEAKELCEVLGAREAFRFIYPGGVWKDYWE